jgi:hypothetical protein
MLWSKAILRVHLCIDPCFEKAICLTGSWRLRFHAPVVVWQQWGLLSRKLFLPKEPPTINVTTFLQVIRRYCLHVNMGRTLLTE